MYDFQLVVAVVVEWLYLFACWLLVSDGGRKEVDLLDMAAIL